MFNQFLIERKKFLEIIYAGGLATLWYFFNDKPIWIQAILDWIQFIFIFVLFLFSLFDQQTFADADERGKQAIVQFLQYWKCLWRVWLILYIIFAINNTHRAIHAELPAALKFSEYDIVDPNLLIKRLTTKSDPISNFLLSQMDTNAQNEISTIGANLVTRNLTSLLALEINRMLDGPLICERVEFRATGITLRPETLQLIGQNPTGLARTRANRFILEDAYPLELSRPRPFNNHYWDTTINLIANVANNLQSFYIFILFLIMTKKTTDEKQKVIANFSQVIILAIAVTGFIELGFSVLGPPLFQSTHDLNADPIFNFVGMAFSTLSGLFAGVAFCLFFGRLGSHYIGLNPLWIAILYLYATIQPLYPMFRIFDTYLPESKSAIEFIQIALKLLAAVLKVALFLRVREILKSGRLLFFMERIARDDESLGGEFNDFLNRSK